MLSQSFKPLLFVSLSVLLPSILVTSSARAGELDRQLQERLDQRGGRKGYAFFLQPESHEFRKIPQDPLNPLNEAKVELGKKLFHETALAQMPKKSSNTGTYSCASCHEAKSGFSSNTRQGIGEGIVELQSWLTRSSQLPKAVLDLLDVQPIKSPPVLNLAWQRNMLWNGQFGAHGLNSGTDPFWLEGTPKEANHFGFEGVETQAIAGLEVHRMIPLAPNASREAIRRSRILQDPQYHALLLDAFPEMKTVAETDSVHLGLAIAAYERTVLSNRAPFQKWLRGKDSAMTEQEKRGALLFFGKANCAECHTGPALNSMSFHALGFKDIDAQSDALIQNPKFTEAMGRASFTQNSEDLHCFKVPQLYNLTDHHSLGHGGSFASGRAGTEYKNRAVPEKKAISRSLLDRQFKPLGLSPAEITDLTVFVEDALYDPQLHRYSP